MRDSQQHSTGCSKAFDPLQTALVSFNPLFKMNDPSWLTSGPN